MEFAAANSNVSKPMIPTLSIQRPREDIYGFCPSDLQKLLPLTPAEKTTVNERVIETDYFGNWNSTPYINGVLSTPDNNPIISGPLKNQERMKHGILERLGQTQSLHYTRLLRGMVNRTLRNHRTVFTHGDLQTAAKEYSWGVNRPRLQSHSY
jgi:hypothetical protein